MLNFIQTADVAAVARPERRDEVFSLGLDLDDDGLQEGSSGSCGNLIDPNLGTDAGDWSPAALGFRYSPPAVSMPLQCGTQLGRTGHIFVKNLPSD